MNRAYSLLEIKAFDDGKRIIEGIATTPSTDRTGDIVEPEGIEFKVPFPFLWQHNHAEPIGQVISAKVTKAGILIKAQLAQTDEPGKLKDLLDYAWQSIKLTLVRGLSIGFRPIEIEKIEGSWGVRFLRSELLELSAVTIPANADASITAIKSIDQRLRAATGQKEFMVVKLGQTPGVSGKSSTQKTEEKFMNIQAQLKKFRDSREAKAARMEEIMNKAADENATLDADQTEEYDGLASEVKSIDAHINRLETLETEKVSKATAVKTDDVNGDSDAASKVRVPATVQLKKELPKGVEFARYVMCLGSAKGDLNAAFNIAKSRFADSPRIASTLKTAVSAGSTTDPTWAAPLVEYNQFAGDFIEFLRPQTILGKFGSNGIPSLRPIPFNVNVRGQTSGGAGYWVGEGDAKPLTSFDFNNTYLGWSKVANIAVITEELLRFSNPSAELLVRDALAGALIARMDTDFVDPNNAGSANVKPASITYGVSVIPSQGASAEDVRADIMAAMSTYIASNITPTTGVWIMSATVALALSLMRNALGQKEFPEITMLGGRLEGLPVIVSEYVSPTSTDGTMVILANASDIWLADDGLITIDASREASLQMATDPTMASYQPSPAPSPVPTQVVSMFQTNSVAIRAERYINWKKRREQAVAVISEVNWGAPTS